MHEILFKKLTPDACAPVRMHAGDAGWDITAVAVEQLANAQAIICKSGLAFAIPRGMWMDVRARSSVYQRGMFLSNGVGTVDSGYRGEVRAVFYGTGDVTTDFYKTGERFAQLVVNPCRYDEVVFTEVDELPPAEDGRDTAGFGSTGTDAKTVVVKEDRLDDWRIPMVFKEFSPNVFSSMLGHWCGSLFDAIWYMGKIPGRLEKDIDEVLRLLGRGSTLDLLLEGSSAERRGLMLGRFLDRLDEREMGWLAKRKLGMLKAIAYGCPEHVRSRLKNLQRDVKNMQQAGNCKL